jgi:S1-C subfamily serine protease
MLPVKAPATAKAPAAAKSAARAAVLDDDDEPVTAKPSRKPTRVMDDDDDFDDRPKKKGAAKAATGGGSKAPLLIAAILGGVVILGGGAAGAYFAFFNDEKKPETTQTTNSDPNKVKAFTIPGPTTTGDPKPVEEKKPDTDAKPADQTSDKTADAKPDANPAANTTAQATPPVAAPVATPPSNSAERMQKIMSGLMDEITMMKVKRATVMIECESKNGGAATGSGWFGIEPGIVITNSHVIDMKAPGSPPPAKLTIFMNAGERGQTPGVLQRDIPHNRIKIIGVDRVHDLAVLQIIGEKDLPEPLSIRPTAQLKDRQGITVFGFPRGYTPGMAAGNKKQPLVSVRPSTVVAVRYDDDGLLSKLQMEGGSSHGNSGGPIVDSDGFVIGVVVSGIDGAGGTETQIAFAVPTEYVGGIMSGEIMDVNYEQAYVDGDKIRVPVKITCADPRGRLQKVGIGVWVGDTVTKVRAPGATRTGKLDSDKHFSQIDISYDTEKKVAVGEIVFPQAAPGLAYWVQPYYVNKQQGQYWLSGKPLTMDGPPVERVDSALSYTVRTGVTRPIQMTSISTYNEYFEGEGQAKNDRTLGRATIKGTERIIDPDKNDRRNAARIRMTYDDIEFKLQRGLDALVEVNPIPPQIMLILKRSLNQIESYGFMDRTGEVYKFTANTAGISDPLARSFAPAISDEVHGVLGLTSVPMPNRTVKPNETWKLVRTHFESIPDYYTVVQPTTVPGGRGGQPAQAKTKDKVVSYVQDITYTYLGVRTRAGKKEAVVRIAGKATPAAGRPADTVTGEIKGSAYIDLNSGTVLYADIESEVEVDSSERGFKKKLSFLEKYKITRGGQTN